MGIMEIILLLFGCAIFVGSFLIPAEKKKQEQESSIMRMKQLRVILDERANARVEVNGEVFGGTKICIADASMVVKNSMSYCKFVKQQGEVKMTAL